MDRTAARNYIKECRISGFSDTYIQERLKESGWSRENIELAFRDEDDPRPPDSARGDVPEEGAASTETTAQSAAGAELTPNMEVLRRLDGALARRASDAKYLAEARQQVESMRKDVLVRPPSVREEYEKRLKQQGAKKKLPGSPSRASIDGSISDLSREVRFLSAVHRATRSRSEVIRLAQATVSYPRAQGWQEAARKALPEVEEGLLSMDADRAQSALATLEKAVSLYRELVSDFEKQIAESGGTRAEIQARIVQDEKADREARLNRSESLNYTRLQGIVGFVVGFFVGSIFGMMGSLVVGGAGAWWRAASTWKSTGGPEATASCQASAERLRKARQELAAAEKDRANHDIYRKELAASGNRPTHS